MFRRYREINKKVFSAFFRKRIRELKSTGERVYMRRVNVRARETSSLCARDTVAIAKSTNASEVISREFEHAATLFRRAITSRDCIREVRSTSLGRSCPRGADTENERTVRMRNADVRAKKWHVKSLRSGKPESKF